MAPSLIVSLLAERSTAELERIREKTQIDLARLRVELEQIESALALQSRGKSHRPRGGGAARQPAQPGTTRKRVLDIVASTDGPVSPADIRRALMAQGHPLSGGGLYTAIKRLTEHGELRRVAEGQYTLASRNDSDSEPPAGPSENGARDPLFTDARPQEAAIE